MKIYQLTFSNGHKDWIAANSLIGALKVWCSETDNWFGDLDDNDEITELPESEWERFTVIMDEDGAVITFKQWMKENRHPAIICSTAYMSPGE